MNEWCVQVRWSGEHVPGSPFVVMIFDTEEELNRFLQVSLMLKYYNGWVEKIKYFKWKNQYLSFYKKFQRSYLFLYKSLVSTIFSCKSVYNFYILFYFRVDTLLRVPRCPSRISTGALVTSTRPTGTWPSPPAPLAGGAARPTSTEPSTMLSYPDRSFKK